jgi:CheY-like chemotaxis protein
MTSMPPLLAVIVEDNVDNAIVLSGYLTKMGIASATRASGMALFRYVEGNPEQKIAVIFLDINMPLENGFDVLRRIRKTPQLAGVKVVAVTADHDDETQQRARQEGFDGLLLKPLRFRDFPDDLKQILHGIKVWRCRE